MAFFFSTSSSSVLFELFNLYRFVVCFCCCCCCCRCCYIAEKSMHHFFLFFCFYLLSKLASLFHAGRQTGRQKVGCGDIDMDRPLLFCCYCFFWSSWLSILKCVTIFSLFVVFALLLLPPVKVKSRKNGGNFGRNIWSGLFRDALLWHCDIRCKLLFIWHLVPSDSNLVLFLLMCAPRPLISFYCRRHCCCCCCWCICWTVCSCVCVNVKTVVGFSAKKN